MRDRCQLRAPGGPSNLGDGKARIFPSPSNDGSDERDASGRLEARPVMKRPSHPGMQDVNRRFVA